MAMYLPWIALLLGMVVGLLLYHIITIGKRADQQAYLSGLQNDLQAAQAEAADCAVQSTQLKAEHKEQIKELRAEVKAHAAEIKKLGADLEAGASGLEARTAELAACQAEAEALRQEVEGLRAGAAIPAATRSADLAFDETTAVDDFTQIKGIGSALAARLANAGLTRYSDLAAADPQDVSTAIGLQPWQKADPAAWIAEAAVLAQRPSPVQIGDNLTRLEGIGPAYATRLRAAGVISFAQLADVEEETLGEIIGAPAWRRVNYTDWIAQARLAAAGDEASLADLQEQLFQRQGDNLALIAGVGPQSLDILHGAGLHTYAALAAATPEQLADLFGEAGGRSADFEGWIAEAKLRAAGKRVRRTRTRASELQGSQMRSCPQDLAQVLGIGMVYEQRLFEAGIGSFWELGMLPDDTLAAILDVESFQDANLDTIKADALRLAEETGTMGHTWDGSEPDDFEVLEQIGPVLERRLYAAGICTYEALAQATVQQLAEICHVPAFQKPDYGRWIAHAREQIAARTQ